MRLIDADALLYDLEIVPLTGDGGVDANDLDDIIKRQQTIEERGTGQWIEDKKASKEHIEKIYRCSACNNFEAWGETELYKFCPNCGVKMRFHK